MSKKKRQQMYKTLHNIRTFASTKLNATVHEFSFRSFKTIWIKERKDIQKPYICVGAQPTFSV